METQKIKYTESAIDLNQETINTTNWLRTDQKTLEKSLTVKALITID
jgi:hypothetical protein